MIGRKNSAPTINEVAALSRVSTATASRALGNYGRVAESTRLRVIAAADELGYRPNSVAQSMITGRTNTIGVVCADIHSSFFSGVVRGITDRASAAGYSVLITNTDESTTTEEAALEALLSKRVDGIIVSPADVARVDHLHRASMRGTPLVLVDRASSLFPCDAVMIDGPEATRVAVAQLLTLGHRRIGIVAELRAPAEADWMSRLLGHTPVDPLTLNPSSARLYGYIRAHHEAGVDVDPTLILRSGAYSAESARIATQVGLAASAAAAEPMTALVAIDSTMSLGAYTALHASDLRIPEDISFIAFDDQDWTELVAPPISVIAQPVYEMGTRAAELLFARLSGASSDAEVVVMDTTLIERESVAPPRSRP